MGRSFQAYLLIVVMCFSVSANLAAVLGGSCERRGVACCGSADCPMRARDQSMPMKCPMHAKAGQDRGTMNCCCSMSQRDTSILPASSFELRYDLPRSHQMHIQVCTIDVAMNTCIQTLDGFFLPPDKPPRSRTVQS